MVASPLARSRSGRSARRPHPARLVAALLGALLVALGSAPALADEGAAPAPAGSEAAPAAPAGSDAAAPADSAGDGVTTAPDPAPPATGSEPAGGDSNGGATPGGEAGDAPAPATTTEQTAVVGTDGQAVANTGSNTVGVEAPPAAPGTGAPSSVGSGPATSQGNDNQVTIIQDVDATATDAAVIDVLQLALVIDLAIAIADSGANLVDAGTPATGGSITSGDAAATGNQATATIRQEARVGDGEVVLQQAQLTNLGVALALTGANTIDGAAGSGALSTGAADATGNRSTTSIAQLVVALAGDRSTLSIVQQALVLNAGIALASTGANAGGGISSGNASALGNDATTAILQQVLAQTSGDGQASVQQGTEVSNLGLALASTGANGVGADLTPLARLVSDAINQLLVQLASDEAVAIAQLRSTVAGPGGTASIQGAGAGTLTVQQHESADGSVAMVRIRQITGSLSIAITIARTGDNIVLISEGPETSGPTAATAGGVGSGPLSVLGASIATGDATAVGNRVTVQICQAHGVEGACTAPVSTPVDPGEDPVDVAIDLVGKSAVVAPAGLTRTGAATRVRAASLPRTGTELGQVGAAGAVAVLVGGALLVAAGRPRRRADAAVR